jgi:hypothetical protein
MTVLDDNVLSGECTHKILAGTTFPTLGGESTHKNLAGECTHKNLAEESAPQRMTVLPKLGEALLPEMHALPKS